MSLCKMYFAFDRHTVQIRFDENDAVTELWADSTDDEALFAPNAIALARRISRADRMLVRFTPFNANRALIEFDVRGFEEHISLVADTCGWSVG